MSKYIHDRLASMLKQDAKNIKRAHDYQTGFGTLKNANILNTLAQLFGWRHFNELTKHTDSTNDAFMSISTLSFDKLNQLKSQYFEAVYQQFSIDTHTIFDPYQLLSGALYNLVNHKRFAINMGKGNNIDVDLRQNKIYLSLTNQEMRHFAIALAENDDGNNGDSMWKGRSQVLIHAMLKAFEHDPDQKTAQDLVHKASSLAFLVAYQKNYLRRGGQAKNIDALKMYIFNIPGMNPDSTYSINSEEQHGYIWMQHGAFHKRFLKPHEQHTVRISMTELKKHNGQVTFIYPDHRDYASDIETLCMLFDEEKVARYDEI